MIDTWSKGIGDRYAGERIGGHTAEINWWQVCGRKNNCDVLVGKTKSVATSEPENIEPNKPEGLEQASRKTLSRAIRNKLGKQARKHWSAHGLYECVVLQNIWLMSVTLDTSQFEMSRLNKVRQKALEYARFG